VAQQTHITLSAAAERLGITYRAAARRLAAQGKLKTTAVDSHEDGRVRLLVSLRSLNSYARKRQKRTYRR
jgi:hypothetical protein